MLTPLPSERLRYIAREISEGKFIDISEENGCNQKNEDASHIKIIGDTTL